MDEKLIYSVSDTVKGHDINQDEYLTCPALILRMQEVSLQHAILLNTSIWDLKDEALSWVLLKKNIHILRHLKKGEQFTTITYPSGFDKFFAFRDFLVFDSNKKLIATASSSWTMINTDTRKISKIPDHIIKIGTPKDTRFLKRPDFKITIDDVATIVDNRKIRPYDLDWNNHVNNVVLSRFMIEPVKEMGIEDQRIKEISIHFKNECQLGDNIKVMQWQSEEKSIGVALRLDNSDKEIALMSIDYLPQTVV